MDKKTEHILKNGLDFCPEMTLAQFPENVFFVQNSRIGVKWFIYKISVEI